MRAFRFSENAAAVISDIVNINFLYFFNTPDPLHCCCLWVKSSTDVASIHKGNFKIPVLQLH